MSKAFLIEDTSNDLMITVDNGQIIKTPIDKIPVYSRTAMGTRMINLAGNPDGVIADVAATVHEEPCEDMPEDEVDTVQNEEVSAVSGEIQEQVDGSEETYEVSENISEVSENT